MARYCVIAPQAVNRTWFDNEAAAIEHARLLLRKQSHRYYCDGSSSPMSDLMVVKVVDTVRISVPIEVVREEP